MQKIENILKKLWIAATILNFKAQNTWKKFQSARIHKTQ